MNSISVQAKLAGLMVGLILLAVVLAGALAMWRAESPPARDPVEHATAACDQLRNTYNGEVATGLGC